MSSYIIFLDNAKLGTTEFENADPSIGVVFGRICFSGTNIGYDFFKDYCKTNKIEVVDDDPDEMMIATGTIEMLVVKNSSGIEIKGRNNQISGMDGDGFEIMIVGIPHPFYEEEFPHHTKHYDDKFTDE